MGDLVAMALVGTVVFLWLMGPTLSEFGRACDVLKSGAHNPNQPEPD